MKSRFTVTLSLRLIGLVLVGITLWPIGTSVSGYLRYLLREENISLNYSLYYFLEWAGTAFLFALGLYLFLGGDWVVNRLFRGLEPSRCSKCNYDMSGLSKGAVCPECGSAVIEG